MVADTFAVAVENARAAEVEHEALRKLKQLEMHRSESLGQMSHDLSTSLNTIIGYSSLLLRENSGPLNDMQRSDLSYINRNGVQLLTLLDGMLELIDESANGDESPPSRK
jgi:signal transduction histidine kinase